MHEDRGTRAIYMLVALLVGGIIMVVIATQTSIVKETADVIEPKETGREVYDVTLVEFTGEQTFWSDKRKVLVNTADGTFVYSNRHVTFAVADEDDTLRVDIVSYDRTGDRAIIHVGKDAIEDIRTKHAEQFGENIQFVK